MANGRGDVDLVIRMRDEAAKALTSITKAVDTLSDRQKDLADSSDDAGSAISKLAQSATALFGKIDSNDTMGKLTRGIDEATAALQRQENELVETQARLAAYQQQINAAANVEGKLREQLDRGNSMYEKRKRQLRDAQAELASLNSQIKSNQTNKSDWVFPTAESQEAIGRAEKLRQVITSLQSSMAATSDRNKEIKTTLNQVGAEQRNLQTAATATTRAIQTQSEQVRTSTTALQQLTITTGAAEQAQRELVVIEQRAVQQSNQIAEAKRREKVAQDEVNTSLRGYSDGARRSLDFTQRIRGQVLSLAAAYIGLHQAINQLTSVVGAFQSVEAAQNRLGSVFDGDQERIGQEMDFLRRNADRLGISFDTLSDQYSKFAVATRGTVLAGEDTRKIFIAVAEAGRVNKLSLDQLQGTFLALTQMVSKGKIQAEELRQQLGERLPGAFGIMAEAVGVSTAELNKMMEQGQLTSDNLTKFAVALSNRFGAQLPKALESTTTAIGRFENAAYQARLQFANAGFIEAFDKALRDLTQNLKSDQFASFLQNLSKLFAALVNVISGIPRHMDLIVTAMSAFIGLKISGYLVNAIADFKGLRTAILGAKTAQDMLTLSATRGRGAVIAATAATRGLGAALSVLAGGPIGIAITAITTAIGLWATRTDTATAAMNQHQKIVDQVKDAYDKAGGSAKDWANEVNKGSRTQAIANLAQLADAYDEAAAKIQRSMIAMRRVAENQNSPMNEDDRAAILEAGKLVDQLRARTITLEDFKKRIDELAQSSGNPKLVEGFKALLDATDNLDNPLKKLSEAQLVVTALTGSAEEAAVAMAKLNGTWKPQKTIIDDNNAAAEEYAKTLEKIRKGTPDAALAVRDKALRELDALLAGQMDSAQGPITPEMASAAKKKREAIEAAYTKALIAGSPGVAAGVVERIMRIESNGNPDARNKRSTAAGLGQFIDSTWIEQFGKVFPEAAQTWEKSAILQLKTGEQNRAIQEKVLTAFTEENVAALGAAGINAGAGDTYLAHFLGKGDAIKVILANPNELVKDLVNSRSIAANPSVFGPNQTAGQLRGWANRLMGGNAPLQASGLTVAEEENAKLLKSQGEALARINRELDQRIRLQSMSREQAEIEQALALTGLDISSKEGQALAAKVQEAYKLTDAESQVNKLMEMRSLLQEQIRYKQEQEGDYTGALALQQQLQGVNDQLKAAINNAIAMWTAIGGPNADLAIAKLTNMSKTLDNKLTKPLIDVQATINSIASNATQGITSAAEAIGGALKNTQSWADAFRATRDALLNFIADTLTGLAQMILQQIIYNTLITYAASMGWFGPGGGSAAGSGSGAVEIVGSGLKLHNGGVPAAGGGTPVGASKGIGFNGLANLRYHGGGVNNTLTPGEVPAILQEDEEVLRASDPRHVNNGGLTPQSTNIKVVNTFDSPSFVSEGLTSEQGTQTLLNVVRANPRGFKSALGIK